MKIQVWVVAPFKRPERDLPDNEFFNNHVSILRIRSEHAIGFLKGRFHSLKNLRLDIRDEKTHKIATYWVAACIGIHSFAMRCEAEEGAKDDSDDSFEDPFIAEGLSSSSESDEDRSVPISEPRGTGGRVRLLAAKARRESLKRRLLRAKVAHAKQRRDDRAAML